MNSQTDHQYNQTDNLPSSTKILTYFSTTLNNLSSYPKLDQVITSTIKLSFLINSNSNCIEVKGGSRSQRGR